MKKLFLSLAVLGFIAIVGCGDSNESATNSERPLLEGWTQALVSTETNKCIAALAGDPKANEFCTCAVKESSHRLTFNAYNAPRAGTPEETELRKIETECTN